MNGGGYFEERAASTLLRRLLHCGRWRNEERKKFQSRYTSVRISKGEQKDERRFFWLILNPMFEACISAGQTSLLRDGIGG
jgi:hypothetical protein